MQLVCKIPDELYKKWEQSKFTLDEAYQFVDCVMNGKPLDAVLDEIKAEFKRKANSNDWYHTTDGLVWEEAIEIIDKYRKGESE